MQNTNCDCRPCSLLTFSGHRIAGLSALSILLFACACRNSAPHPSPLSEWQQQLPGLAPRLAIDSRSRQRILLAPAPIYFGPLHPLDDDHNLARTELDFGPAQTDVDAYLEAWRNLCQEKLPPHLSPPQPDALLLPPADWRKIFTQADYQNSIVHLYQAMSHPGLDQQQRIQLQCLALFQQQQQLLSQALNDLARLNRGQADNFPTMVNNFHRLRQFQQQFASTLNEQILPELCAAAESFLQPLLPLLQHPDCSQPQSALQSLWMAVPEGTGQTLPLQSSDSADWRALNPSPCRYAALAEAVAAAAPAQAHIWLVMSFAAPAPPPGKIYQLAMLPLPADSEVYFQGRSIDFQPAEPLFIALLPPDSPNQEYLIAIKFSAQELGRQICPPWICAKDAPADKKTSAAN